MIVVRAGRRGPCLLALSLLLWASAARADALGDLIKKLQTDESYKVRVVAALSLGKLGDARAVQPLIAALADENYTVRGTAAAALGRLGDQRAVAPLGRLRSDDNAFVRSSAEKALAALQAAEAPAAEARIYVDLGPMAAKAKQGAPADVKWVHDVLARELAKVPTLTTAWRGGGSPSAAALQGAGVKGYFVDGSIVRLSTSPAGSYTEIECDLKVLVATFPGKSILMWTDGGAAVQTGISPKEAEAGRRDCLEAAAQAVHENIVTFLKAQAM